MFHRSETERRGTFPNAAGLGNYDSFSGWAATMIHFDGLRSFGRASYLLQTVAAAVFYAIILADETDT